MSYQLQAGAPQFTFGGQNYAVGAFVDQTPIGGLFLVGLFQPVASGGDNLYGAFEYNGMADNTVLSAVQAVGGIAAFNNSMLLKLNAILATLATTMANSPTPTPTGEPTDGASAIAAITAFINSLKITVVNGVPVASVS